MSTRAEVCAVACAELFRDAGEIMVSPMTNMASVGARLARLTFSPDIVLTDGEAQLLADTPALGAAGPVEGWMPFSRVFETLAWGRRHVGHRTDHDFACVAEQLGARDGAHVGAGAHFGVGHEASWAYLRTAA